jgi:hypothetical protein
MTTTEATDTEITVETRASHLSDGAWADLLARLNNQSVHKHFEAYVDIAWDSDELRLDPTDPRWELDDDPLGETDWYKALPAATRARLGCEMTASKMKTGLQFENILKRGLLEHAFTLPNGSAEFRYAYHEVIEEAQHALMFQEFVNRSGYDAPGLNRMDRLGSRAVIGFARHFPELFFVFVLGGEDPIDHVQRQSLRRGGSHPLVERIMRIHVTEEARHLSFARHYLKRAVPKLSRPRRAVLAVGAPLVLATMADMMLKPSRHLIARYDIPADAIAAAYTDNPEHRAATVESLAKVRGLCEDLGLLGRPFQGLWRVLGLTAPS